MEQWFPMIDPQNVLGIEISPYAAELARLTIWIGQIQWMLRHGYQVSSNPVLKSLDQIACCNALLNEDGSEAEWPRADCIIGNPPFLGDKKMITELGEDYVTRLRRVYKGRVPGGADLVAYWFDKAWRQIERGMTTRSGLVATNSIRGGQNRKVVEAIAFSGQIYAAWSDEPWVLDGAAVRVSLICFTKKVPEASTRFIELNGEHVVEIYPDLTAWQAGDVCGANLTTAQKLSSNKGIAIVGTQKNGAFDIAGDLAREWLRLPRNPNGRLNGDVVVPWLNGIDITRRRSDTWVIDFGVLSEEEAALYEAPFEYIRRHVRKARQALRRASYRNLWWRHAEPRPSLRIALSPLRRYIATPRVAKHRLFVWTAKAVLPDCAVVAIARDDDTTFGILHSRFHELWALRMGTSLEDRPRYTPSSTFETFPFPSGLSPEIPAFQYAADPRAGSISRAAIELNGRREGWLNPQGLFQHIPEVASGFPDRVMPIDDNAADQLRKRTLTSLYNKKPTWLLKAHQDLDEAVANAYGWSNGISDDEVLARLLRLNAERIKSSSTPVEETPRKGPSHEQRGPVSQRGGFKRREAR
jgi:type II restriction/modification system DNA methylase subunit YeeA